MENLFPAGPSDFRRLREDGLHYVDKTRLIRIVLDEKGRDVLLLPRPRRFGKTLNLTTLRYFFEKRDEDLSHLYRDLEIWRAGDEYLEHFQRYPVIHMTFKDIKPETAELWEGAVASLLSKLYLAHLDVLEALPLRPRERAVIGAIVDAEASPAIQRNALEMLTGWLHKAFGEPVVVLIDEYDTPIQEAWLSGFSGPVLGFFRWFLGGGLKDNPHLFKAVVTGILRVAKENIFSGLNNLGVYTILDPVFSDCFGFTEEELDELLERTGTIAHQDVIRQWYDGYGFGGTTVYNPWSVMSFLADPLHRYQAHWLNTSSNSLIKELLQHHAFSVERDVRRLLEGGAIEQPIYEGLVLSQVRETVSSLWTLLLFSGYLKAEEVPVPLGVEPRYRLSIPNLEVRKIFLESFVSWMGRYLPDQDMGLDRLRTALFKGDAEGLQRLLEHFAVHLLSYHDPGGQEPEKLYQGFVVGLCAFLDATHRVRSNRESGQGRPDLLILPREPGQPGVAMEFKVAGAKRSLEQALGAGEAQMTSRDYAAELRDCGADPIHAFVVAFDGKRVEVRGAGAG